MKLLAEVRVFRKYLSLFYRKICLTLFKSIITKTPISSRLLLGYSSRFKSDGLGAQLQRILALNALGEFWNIQVSHPPLNEIAVHPLDGFVDEISYKDYLNKVNFLIQAQNLELSNTLKQLYIENLKARHLLSLFFRTILRKERIHLLITHPYFFVDANPRLYECRANQQISQNLKRFVTQDLSDALVLHHRHGVGNMAIQPGQNRPREIPISKYETIVNEISQVHPFLPKYLYTDAPEFDLLFEPPKDQKHSWQNLPNFSGDFMFIHGASLFALTQNKFPDFIVKRGGNPLETLANITTSKYLIASNSSFSYVAGLLGNHSRLWIPKNFWHTPLLHWIQYD